ncbi:hypothetical protein ACH5RR_013217 [Cinchona calisaya]|uniref:Zinc knuckle CX2CX4HX4C domain-containing protein n=1 Tax=Cinchona calisaya TaxID=153742 RepID=A0ABD3A2Q1_9GENT
MIGTVETSIKGIVMGENHVLFQFTAMAGMKKVMEGVSWTLDKNIVLLKDFNGDVQPSKLKFRDCTFWVRLYSLPLNHMDAESGYFLGNKIGTTLIVDGDDDCMAWGKFLRVRVSIDINKSLPRFIKLLFGGVSNIIFFQYKRLQNFCYHYGLLGHGEKDCESRTLNHVFSLWQK